MNLSRKVSSDAIVTGLIRVGTQFRGLLIIPLIGKLLGVDSYGAYVQILAITGVCSVLLEFGLHTALIKYGQESSRDLADLYYSLTSFATACGGVATVAIVLFADPISQLTLGNTSYAYALVLGSVLVPLNIFSGMARNVFRVEMNVKAYSIIEGVKSYLSVGAVAVALLAFNTGLGGVIVAVVLTELVVASVVQLLIGRKIGYVIPTFEPLEESLRYSLPLAVSDVSDSLSSRGDRLLIGYFLGASAVGIYSVVYSVASFIMVYSGSIYTTLFPEVSRLIENEELETCEELTRNGVKYFIIIAVPSVFGLYLLGPTVVRTISTTETAAASETLLPVIMAGIIFYGLELLFNAIPNADGDTMAVLKIHVFATMLNLGLNWLLIPAFGIIGAAMATLVTYVLTAAMMYWLSNRRLHVALPLTTSMKSIVASILMTVLALTVLQRQFLLTLVVGPIIYFGVMILTKGIEPSKVREVISSRSG